MNDIIFTYYHNVKDTQGETKNMPWHDWKNVFSAHAVRGTPADSDFKPALELKKNGPCVVLGQLKGPRRKANVVAIYALALDLEDQTDQDLAEVLEKLAPFEWCLYSTHKSGAAAVNQQTRLRIILPLAEALRPEEFFPAWDELNEFVGGVNDLQTRDLARLHFLPSTFDPSKAIAYANDGDRWAPGKTGAAPTTENKTRADRPFEEILFLLNKKARVLRMGDELRLLVKRIQNGEPIAEPGERHSKILTLTYWLATALPELNEHELARLFEKSIEAMANQAGAGPVTLGEIKDAYTGALRRATEDTKNKKAPPSPPVQTNAYSPEELEDIAKRQGWTPEELGDKWVIQKAGSIWVLKNDGDYEGPFSKEDAPIAIRRHLGRAPVQIWTATASGFKMRAVAEIVADHGSLARKVVVDLGAQFTTFEPSTSTITESVVPIRKELKAVENKAIDKWLDVFSPDHSSKLRDWLACCPDPKKQLCALYLDGEKESGKTLFAVGAARLWTRGGPAEVEQVLNNFNEELLRCPLVFADEQVPKSFGGQSASAKLRALLGVKERTLKRKYLPNADLTGALRLVLAANNESLLDELDAHTAADLEAIAQRFLYIHVDAEASVKYLSTFSKATLEEWAQTGIAEHALWLQENHVIEKPGRRFWVEGDLSMIHRLLLTGGHWTSLVCEWLLRYLLNPRPLHADAEVNGLVRIEDERLLVNEQAIADKWSLYLKNVRQDPQVRQIGQALRSISSPHRKQLRWARRAIRYRVVETSHLIAWSERHGIGDEQAIKDRLSGVIPLDEPIDNPRSETEENKGYKVF